jgi:hypothetical protein
MDVSILEAGRHGPPAELDDSRLSPDQRGHRRIRADGDDPAVSRGEGARPGTGGIHRGDAAATQDEVGWMVDRHRPSLPGRSVRLGRIPPGATA